MMQPTELGTTPEEGAGRDAIHVAVIPAVAEGTIYPAQRVSIEERGGTFIAQAVGDEGFGICDPFQTGRVNNGERVWVMLDPGTITDMRHHWSHPNIPDDESAVTRERIENEAGVAEAWMRGFARDIGLSYDQAIGAGDSYACDDGWGGYTFKGRDTPSECTEELIEYWESWSAIRGRPIPKDAEAPFSCSC